MKKQLGILTLFTTLVGMVGCAGNDTRYYEAVAEAAKASAAQTAARYEALAQLAANGGPATQASAAMAIALTEAPVIAPAYIESQALKWAQVLAAPITGIAGMHYQYKANQASVSANRDIQLGQQGMFVDLSAANAGATAGAVGGFTSAIVDVASQGLTATQSVAAQGLAGVQATAETGLQSVTGTAATGIGATETIALDNNATFLQSLDLRRQELDVIINGFEPVVVNPLVVNPVVVETQDPLVVNPQVIFAP